MVLSVVFACSGSLHAEAIIYEGFDYDTGGIDGENGGTGFSGAWDATRNNPAVTSPNFTWGSLPTSGNHIKGNAWSAMIRPIGATLSSAGLMDNGETLWFSAVMDLQGQNLTNADLNFGLGSDQFEGGVFGDRKNLVGGEGIGVGHIGGGVKGVYWQNTDADAIAEINTANTSRTLNSTDDSRALIVGKIDWGATNTDDELLTLYAPGSDLELGTAILDEWATPALNQASFDSMIVQFKDSSQLDEIRFGATSDDVLGIVAPVPEPSTFALAALGLLGLGWFGCRRRN